MKFSAIVALTVVGLLSSASSLLAASGTATFEQNSEGDFWSGPLTDRSGIAFSNFQNTGVMAVDFVGPNAYSKIFSNTNYVTGSGFANGPGFSLSARFGFDAQMPVHAAFVSLDIFASTNQSGIVTLTGYDSTGNAVASGTWSPTTKAAFSDGHVSISASSAEIDRITVRATSGDGPFGTGYDNIYFKTDVVAVPEPATAALLACALVPLLVMRPASRHGRSQVMRAWPRRMTGLTSDI